MPWFVWLIILLAAQILGGVIFSILVAGRKRQEEEYQPYDPRA